MNIIFFAVFVFFAFSFFGYYELTLPSSWGNRSDAASTGGGILGIFFIIGSTIDPKNYKVPLIHKIHWLRSQVGDSFIITEDGHEQITHHSKAIEDLIIN